MAARIRQLEEALRLSQGHASQSGSGSPSSPSGMYGSILEPSMPEFNALVGNRIHMEMGAEAAQRQQILGMLPDENTARLLLDQFYVTYGWLVQPISRSHLFNVLFKRAYSVPCTASNSEISALCSVFSLATAGELLQQQTSLQDVWHMSAQFHDMSMAALRLDDVLGDASVSTIEAMVLQCCYLYLASESDQIQRAWNYIGVAVRVAQSIGLHHDPKLLDLDDEECQRRRRVFHELIAIETWICMIIERPPSVQGIFFSTEMPYDNQETLGNDPAFFRWKHDFCREGIMPIVNEIISATIPPTYSTILGADKLVRHCAFPAKLQFIDFATSPIEVLLQSQQVFMMQELALMKLHKAEFLRALKEYPDDPFKSHAAYSVQTVIDSAMSLLKRLRTISTDCARLLPRLSCPWEAAIACLSYLDVFLRNYSNEAVVGSVYVEFEMGCKLVMDHADDTSRIAKLIPHVLELRRRVHEMVPHLTESLRRALSERRKSEAANSQAMSLEYPLGPAPDASLTTSLYPFVGTEGEPGPSIVDLGSGEHFVSNAMFNGCPPVGDVHGLFDGAHFGHKLTMFPVMASSVRFEVPSSTAAGSDVSMVVLDGSSDPKSANSQQAYGGHFRASF